MSQACRNTRVVKKLSPTQPGALKLARRYGDALVCVRYRQDPEGLHRFTTIELVVDDAPVVSKRTQALIVGVRIGRGEHDLRRLAKSHGAKWDPATFLWHMSRSAVRELGLERRVVQK